MFRHASLPLALVLTLLVAFLHPAAAEPSPAAYITAIELTGKDSAEGTAIRRNGALLAPRLLMALYAGDEVFLREATSRIVIETGDGAEQVIAGGASLTLTDGPAADGGLWDILDTVAEALGGGADETAPDNMMTRDDGEGLRIPMAIRGANHLARTGGPVWIAWSGGAAPFRISVSAGGTVTVQDGVTRREASLDLPATPSSRIRVKIEDAGGRTETILFRLQDEPPRHALTRDRGITGEIAHAAWLTAVDDGRWTFEAARQLRNANGSPAAAALLARIALGWKASPPKTSGN